jgi:hypothetical protein
VNERFASGVLENAGASVSAQLCLSLGMQGSQGLAGVSQDRTSACARMQWAGHNVSTRIDPNVSGIERVGQGMLSVENT